MTDPLLAAQVRHTPSPFARLPLEVLTEIIAQVAPTPRELLALQAVSRQVRQACRQDLLWRSWRPDADGDGPRLTPPPPLCGEDPGAKALVHDYLHAVQQVQVRRGNEVRWFPFARKRRMLRALYRLDAIVSGREPAATPGAQQLRQSCHARRGYLLRWLHHSDAPRIPRLSDRPIGLDPRQVGHLFRRCVAQRFACDEVRFLLATVGERARLRVGGDAGGVWSMYADFDVVRAMLPLDPHLACVLEAPLRRQHGLMARAIDLSGLAWAHAAPELQARAGLFDAALRQTPWALTLAEDARRRDRASCLAAVRRNGATLSVVDAALRDDESFIAACLDGDGMLLEFASARLQAEPATVLRAVRQNGRALQFAARALQGDDATVEAAARQHGEALLYAEPRLLRSRPLLALALPTAPSLLPILGQRRAVAAGGGPGFPGHPHVEAAGGGPVANEVWAAVHLGPAEAVNDDEALVLAAVSAEGQRLASASPRLRAATHVVLAAVRRAPAAFRFALAPAADSPALARFAVAAEPRTFGDLPEALQRHPRVFAAFVDAVGRDALVYRAAGRPLAHDADVTRRLFRRNPALDVALAASEQDDPTLLHGFVCATLARRGLDLRFFGPSVAGDARYVGLAVAQNGLALAFASPGLCDDAPSVRVAVTNNGLALYYASARLRDELSLVRAAAAQNPMALEYASTRCRQAMAGGVAEAAYRVGLRWWHKWGDADRLSRWGRRRWLAEAVGGGWRGPWSSQVDLDEPRRCALHAGHLTAHNMFAFFGDRDLKDRPSPALAEHHRCRGERLPPPLVDLPFLAAQAAERPGPRPARPLMPRALSTQRFVGYMARHFDANGVPRT